MSKLSFLGKVVVFFIFRYLGRAFSSFSSRGALGWFAIIPGFSQASAACSDATGQPGQRLIFSLAQTNQIVVVWMVSLDLEHQRFGQAFAHGPCSMVFIGFHVFSFLHSWLLTTDTRSLFSWVKWLPLEPWAILNHCRSGFQGPGCKHGISVRVAGRRAI